MPSRLRAVRPERREAQVKARPGKAASRRDDCRQGLEWQLQGEAPLGGRPLANVIDAASVVNVPELGPVKFQDKARQLKAYLAAGVEACEMTVKRDGEHYYACIAVRGLQPAAAHVAEGVAVGIDMGVANPLATSEGELITHHQGHEIRARLSRLERRKLRAKRQYDRKLRHAAKRAGALTATGGIRKGVKIENSNRMRRCWRGNTRSIGRLSAIARIGSASAPLTSPAQRDRGCRGAEHPKHDCSALAPLRHRAAMFGRKLA